MRGVVIYFGKDLIAFGVDGFKKEMFHMSLYGLSVTNKILACQWGRTDFDGYHDCEHCSEYYQCPEPYHLCSMREENIPPDCPHTGCLNCPRPFFGTCNFFNVDF